MPTELTLLIPVYNNEPGLAVTLAKLRRAAPKAELLLVWDVTRPGLQPPAKEEAAALKKKFDARTIFRFDEKGFGSALRRGFAEAKGQVTIVTMADLCDDPKIIPQMLRAIRAGADLVAATRYSKGGRAVGGGSKQRLGPLVSCLVSAFSTVKCTDVTNAFKAYRTPLLRSIQSTADRFDLSMELTVKAGARGARIAEVPTTWTNKFAGKTNFAVRSEAPRYLKWFLWAALKAPSKLTLALFFLLGAIVGFLMA
ncbi:MAG TPA: glycosyltransferase [archaeon]|nr:glycosyltransferase [archaeon]